MAKPFGVEIRFIHGKEFAIWRNHVRDEMYYDGRGNPIFWFAKELETQDILVCGLDTKREVLEWLEDTQGKARLS